MSAVQWGTVGEWAGAIAGFSAVIYAIRIGSGESRSAQRRQAEQVAVWEEDWWRDDRTGQDGPVIVVFNGSSLPISDLRVPYWGYDDDGQESLMASLLGALEPRERKVEPIHAYLSHLGPYPYEVEFRDVTGRRWQRTTEGGLTELGAPSWWSRTRSRVGRRGRRTS